jgi:SAM-dependent methyltransferase/GT2 family glycosyltransferase
MVKNEQDIIEPFIRHNLQFVDGMVIIDNASTDATRDIVAECARELGNIIVADSEEFAYTQSERMTRALHYCQTAFFADFVLLLDADEFICAADRTALEAVLETIPSGGVGLLPWRTFVLSPFEASIPEDPPRSIRVRRAAELPLFRKAALRLDGNLPRLVIAQGNHTVTTESGDAPKTIDLDQIPLLHFPVRSTSQLIAKSVIGWIAMLARNPAAREEGVSFQWRQIFEALMARPLPELDRVELCEASMRYAQTRNQIDWLTDTMADTPPAGYVRRYSNGSFADPLILIAKSWARSFALPRPLLTLERPPGVGPAAGVSETVFDPTWHWDHIFLDIAPFRYLAEKYRPANVLDVGCGLGGYLVLFKNLGSDTLFGIDGLPHGATALRGEEYTTHDLTQPLELGKLFDLVVCVEVAEHLEGRYEEILLDSVVRHAAHRIIFSAAEPGQPGNGHINCQPISHWLARFADRGWIPNLVDSLGVRCLATMSWFRRNLVVLERGPLAAGADAIAALEAIAARPFTWYNQVPGIRWAPFTELPPTAAGYAANWKEINGPHQASVKPEGGDRAVYSESLSELRRELQEWGITGRKVLFWWRDDDAVSDTRELRRLLALAEEIGTIIALAVIPDLADNTLAKLVATSPCCIWQHGWRHHWQHEERDCSYSQGEFGEGRSLESMMTEAHNGQLALDRMFGEAGWQRVFVPPFHALSVPFKRLLPSLGYWGLSAGLPLTLPIDTVAEVNAEIDIMNWAERKSHGPDVISKMLIEQLISRRQGRVSVDTPIGLLTHHLAHDEEAWRFLRELLCFLKGHPAVEVVPADRLFSQRTANLPGLSCGAGEVGLDEVTVVVTSCGRQDLLETTLDSFLQYNTFPIKEFIIIEDGDGAKNRALAEKYRGYPFKWLATGERVGQIAAIDRAYREVRTELIFHCEDDWEFLGPGFIEKSLAILAQNHSILQVWIRALNDTNGCPVLNYTLTAAGIPYRLICHDYNAGKNGIWHGFSWNPGLRRRRDYRFLCSFASLDPETTRETWQVESDASAFYRQRSLFAAILADNGGNGYARHIGWGRQTPRDYLVQRRTAVRDRDAQLLMARLASHPRFGRLCHHCGREDNPGIDELPEWQIWTNRATTPDQLAIEEQLENLVTPSSSILHIGAGNSSLGRRFAPRVSTVVGTTLHDEERILSEELGIENYAVVRANKYSEDMDRIAGSFDFIVDNNPSSFACCLFHFSRMMIAYGELLRRDGGLFMTAQQGWGWVVTGNASNWSLGWDDWALLGEILRMPVARVTDFVYSMQRLPYRGIRCVPDSLRHQSSAFDAHDMQQATCEAELLGQIKELTSVLGSARAQTAEREAQARRASAEVTVAKQAAAALQAELEAVYASWSWRVTKPLRSIGARYPGLMRWGLEPPAFAWRLRSRISLGLISRRGR